MSSTNAAGPQIRQIGNYQVGEIIGRGAAGTVYKAVNLLTGKFVAIKQISATNFAEVETVEAEIALLKLLKHPNIVKYIETLRTDENLNIVTEYVENGSLQHLVKKFGRLLEQLVQMITINTLNGLIFLHDQGVIHRDIKGANILVADMCGHVKLADFGVSIKASEMTKEGADENVAGTPYWMAPEVIKLKGASQKSDIWSLGCTILEMLTGDPPYFNIPPLSALYRIDQDDHPPLPSGISPALEDFLLKCFKKEPELRASGKQLMQHHWLSRRGLGPILNNPSQIQSNQQGINAISSSGGQGRGMNLNKRKGSGMQGQYKIGVQALIQQQDGDAEEIMRKQERIKGYRDEFERGSPLDDNDNDNETIKFDDDDDQMSVYSLSQQGKALLPSPSQGKVQQLRNSAAFKIRLLAVQNLEGYQEKDDDFNEFDDLEQIKSSRSYNKQTKQGQLSKVDSKKLRKGDLNSYRENEEDDTIEFDDDDKGVEQSLNKIQEKQKQKQKQKHSPLNSKQKDRNEDKSNSSSLQQKKQSKLQQIGNQIEDNDEDGLQSVNWDEYDRKVKTKSFTDLFDKKLEVNKAGGTAKKVVKSNKKKKKKKGSKYNSKQGSGKSNDTSDDLSDITNSSDLSLSDINTQSDSSETETDEQSEEEQTNEDEDQNEDEEDWFDDDFQDDQNQWENANNNGPDPMNELEVAKRMALATQRDEVIQQIQQIDEGVQQAFETSSRLKNNIANVHNLQESQNSGKQQQLRKRSTDAQTQSVRVKKNVDIGTKNATQSEQNQQSSPQNNKPTFQLINDPTPTTPKKNKSITTNITTHQQSLLQLIKDDKETLVRIYENLAQYAQRTSELLTRSPVLKDELIVLHGLIPLMEMLELDDMHVQAAAIQLTNVFVDRHQKLQETVCLIGMLPAVLMKGGRNQDIQIRTEIAALLYRMLCGTEMTINTIISARCLPYLCSMIDCDISVKGDAQHQVQELLYATIRNIHLILRKKSNNQQDLEGQQQQFGLTINSGAGGGAVNVGLSATETLRMVVDIISIFASSNRSVSVDVASEELIRPLLVLIPKINDEKLSLSLITSIRFVAQNQLSMKILEDLGTIPKLVEFFNIFSQSRKIQNQLVQATYYLSQLSHRRTELFAEAGAIPILQGFVQSNSQLTQFVIDYLLTVPSCGPRGRQKLWEADGVNFLLGLLTNSQFEYLTESVYEALHKWMRVDGHVGKEMSKPENAPRLLYPFIRSDKKRLTSNDLQNLLQALFDMISQSSALADAVGANEDFWRKLVSYFGDRDFTSSALLENVGVKMMIELFKHNQEPKLLIHKFKLVPIVEKLCERTHLIVVQLANKLLLSFRACEII
ncbi:MAG: putative Cytokinesis protein sepH [Streblomastix strix]|uniref:Putative Cytokinesis protein sepH n=1 Tax=Streblomastix strix TaxID=222440 RepID=A0A5J4WJ89_9EUKA|nr:MAG: putative Cytokinesis protein sepH [Streblomastix strix]